MSAIAPDALVRHPRFELRRPLGAGGMGAVYEAFDRETQTVVALKTTLRASPSDLLLFKNEFRALADLHHPNLVHLLELHCEEGCWFFTMELLRDAVDLRTWVRVERPSPEATVPMTEASMVDASRLPTVLEQTGSRTAAPLEQAELCVQGSGARCAEERLRPALEQLALGLAALHAQNRVHRDIKPSNVLVTPAGRVVLLDFGLVVAADDAALDHIAGTPVYMAPEQAVGVHVGPATDWYAVGALLYECLTGAPPFAGSVEAILAAKRRRDPTPVDALVPQAPADLRALCTALLARDPAQRPTGDEVLARLGVGAGRPTEVRSQAPAFVGRARELRALDEALEQSRRRAVSVFVHGESGLGKSALIRRFLEALDGRADVAVLTGRCFDREQVPFKAFDGVIDALVRKLLARRPEAGAHLLGGDAALLGRMFPVLSSGATAPPETAIPSDPVELRTRAFAALRGLFARLGELRQVVIFVDDMQWADADSLALLRELVRPPGAPTLLFLASVRGGPEAAMRLADLDGDVRTVALPPLSADEANALARIVTGVEQRDVDAIARASGGHPLFLQELARHADSVGPESPTTARLAARSTSPAGVGLARHTESAECSGTTQPRQDFGRAKLDDALWARVARLPAPERSVIEVVAVAGAPLAHRHVGEAAALSPDAYSTTAAALRAANLVQTAGVRPDDTVEAYHARVGEAVLAHLDPETRRQRHRALADALDRAGVGEQRPELLVRYLEGAGEDARAATLARRAAERAEGVMAFEQAAHFYGVALRLGRPPAAEARQLELRLAEALASAGRGPEAADTLLAVAARAEGSLRLDSQRKAVEHLLGSGHFQRGLMILREICDDVGVPFPETRGRAMLSAIWQRTKIRAHGFRWTERDEREVSPDELRRLDVYTAIGVGLSQVGLVRGEDFHARGLLLALRVGERRRIARYFLYEAMYRSNAEDWSVATRLFEAGARIASELDDPYLLGLAAGSRGVMALSANRHLEAADGMAEGERIWRSHGIAIWEMHVTAALLFPTTVPVLGRIREERPHFESLLRQAEQRGDRLMETILRTSCIFLWLARDDADGAERTLDTVPWRLADIVDEGVSRFESWWEVYELWARVEIGLYRGDRARLKALRPELDEVCASLLGGLPMSRVRSVSLQGRVALALGQRPEARAKARALDAQSTRYANLQAKLIRAACCAQEGDRAGAAVQLGAAQELADSLGTRLVAAAARRRRGEMLGGDSGRELVHEADARMRAEGIVEPERMADVVAPGFRAFAG